MRVSLLGRGAADGWPDPWRGCPSCEDARLRGEARRPTSEPVHHVLLLYPAPAPPPAGVPARQGVRLGADGDSVTTRCAAVVPGA